MLFAGLTFNDLVVFAALRSKPLFASSIVYHFDQVCGCGRPCLIKRPAAAGRVRCAWSIAGRLMPDNKAGSSTVIGLIAVAIAALGFAMLFLMAWA
jgi:hypothetical protein